MTRFRIWVQVAITLAINMAALAVLAAVLIEQQTDSSLESFLYAPARERVRELGRMLEEEFPGMPPGERTAWLAKVQEPLGVTLTVYDDTGALVAGPDLGPPAQVLREIQRRVSSDAAARPRPKRRKQNGPPLFLVKEESPKRYWIGYHFPIVMNSGDPPVRHTLAVVSSSLLRAPFFVNWTPWITGACLALVVTVACWIPLVRRMSSSIQAVRKASAEIAEGRFDAPLPVTGSDELAGLASSIRRMAGQLAQLVGGQRRFLADVAHELCAPLSRIQLSAGILSQSPANAGSATVERLERDVSHMSELVAQILEVTKASVRKAEIEPVVLARIVSEAIVQESETGAKVTAEIDPGLIVMADAEYLKRALANVVRNAIQYAGNDGPIVVSASRSGGKVVVRVSDCGPGIPESELDAVFSSFYRLDGARTPGTGGAGLGLAIVKSCVEACGGTVSCRNRESKGLEVVIELPSAD